MDKLSRAKGHGERLDADEKSPDVSFANINGRGDMDVQRRGNVHLHVVDSASRSTNRDDSRITPHIHTSEELGLVAQTGMIACLDRIISVAT